MCLTNAEAMREMMLRAVDGTPEGITAAAALIADDARVWQQGASWSRGLGSPLETRIRSLIAVGDKAAVETRRGVMLVAVFAVFRDGLLACEREYFAEAPPADVFVG